MFCFLQFKNFFFTVYKNVYFQLHTPDPNYDKSFLTTILC